MEVSKNTNVPFTITGNWALQTEQLKKKYPQLTDADLKFETGQEDQLVQRVVARLNKNQEHVIAILKGNHLA